MRRGENLDGFLSGLSKERLLLAFQHGGLHLTINTERERAFAETHISEFLTLMDGVKV